MKTSLKRVFVLALTVLMFLTILPGATGAETVTSDPFIPGQQLDGTGANEKSAADALFERLIAYESSEALLTAMQALTAEENALLEAFTAEQNAALTALVENLGAYDAALTDRNLTYTIQQGGSQDVTVRNMVGWRDQEFSYTTINTGISARLKGSWWYSGYTISVASNVPVGTYTLEVNYLTEDGGDDEIRNTDTITITVTEAPAEDTQVYYLKTPTSDPDSNAVSQWGRNIGTGSVRTDGATWTNDRNVFNPAPYIVSMADGMTKVGEGWLLPKATYADDYTTIFNAYKEEIERELGVTIVESDIEAIYLIPHKISRNNNTQPDKHIDCTINVVTKKVFAAVFWVTMPSGEVKQADAKNYTLNSTIAKTSNAPTETTGTFPNRITTDDGTVYEFDGWYNEAGTKVADTAWPYTPSTEELSDGTVNFYAKYTPVLTSVIVTKTVSSGIAADSTRAFSFTCTINNEEAFTFTLANGESKTIADIPAGATVVITETEDENFITSHQIDAEDAVQGATATIQKVAADGHSVAFTNARRTGSLTVEKLVTGSMGDRTKAFGFTYRYEINGATVTGTFDLRHGETWTTVNAIPYGTAVVIEEVNEGGYTTSYRSDNGESVNGRKAELIISGENHSVVFTNEKNAIPDMGVLLDSLPYIIILAVVVAIGVIVFIRKRRNGDDD